MSQSLSESIRQMFGRHYKLISVLAVVLVLGLGAYLLIPRLLPSFARSEVQSSPPLFLESVPDFQFRDEFVDVRSGWPTDEQHQFSFGYQSPTYFFLEVASANEELVVFRGMDIADFVAESEVIVNYTNTTHGDFRYGLAVRGSGEQYYTFTISPRTKSWQVGKHGSARTETLAEGTDSTIQGLFEVHKLSVSAVGPTFSFLVDGQRVAELSDAAYAGGDIGFFVETLDEPLAHVLFDSLLIREADVDLEALPKIVSSPLSSTVAPTPIATGTIAASIEPGVTPTSLQLLPTLRSSPTPTPSPPTTPSPASSATLSPQATATLTPTPTASSLPSSSTPTVTSTATPAPTETLLPSTATPSSTPDETVPAVTSTPGATETPSPVPPTPTSSVPSGSFTLLNPLDPEDPTYGPTDFEWIWTGGPLPPDYGFEVRIWREDEEPVGAHNAVLDNQQGQVENLGDNRYRLSLEISDAAGVRGLRGEYLWTVALVQINPDYADLGQQAAPAQFRFETPGG